MGPGTKSYAVLHDGVARRPDMRMQPSKVPKCSRRPPLIGDKRESADLLMPFLPAVSLQSLAVLMPRYFLAPFLDN